MVLCEEKWEGSDLSVDSPQYDMPVALVPDHPGHQTADSHIFDELLQDILWFTTNWP